MSADCDARAWPEPDSGFTGSRAFCIALMGGAGLSYRVEIYLLVLFPRLYPFRSPGALRQCCLRCVRIVCLLCCRNNPPPPTGWRAACPNGAVIGFDPWLHTPDEIDALERGLAGSGVTLTRIANPIDPLWAERPAPPMGAVMAYPETLAGLSSAAKRRDAGQALAQNGQSATVLTQPDSIWLASEPGAEPTCRACRWCRLWRCCMMTDGWTCSRTLAKFHGTTLEDGIALRPHEAFEPALRSLTGPVRVDRATVARCGLRYSERSRRGGCPDARPLSCPQSAQNRRRTGRRAAQLILRDGRGHGRIFCAGWTSRRKKMLTDSDPCRDRNRTLCAIWKQVPRCNRQFARYQL